MATFTTKLGLRKPAPTDVVNVTTDISDSMDIIDAEMGIELRSSFPASPYLGKTITRTDLSYRTFFWDGGAWRELLAVSAVMPSVQDTDATDITVTSTTYTTGTPVVDLFFTAPVSGKVFVTVTAALEAAAPSTIYVSYEVRETDASGTIVSGTSDEIKAVIQQEDKFHQGSTRSMVSGLTPGSTYYCRLMQKVSANAGTCFYRGLLIEPAIW